MLFRIGSITVTKIPELSLEAVIPSGLLPSADEREVRQAAMALDTVAVDHTDGTLRQSIHSWLIQTSDRVILLDTATGNDKDRPTMPILHHLRELFIERLRGVGISADQVTDVLITHIHADHVGWNTYLRAGEWLPTFPNAKYHFSGLEADYSAALAAEDKAEVDRLLTDAGLGIPHHPPAPGVYEDSIAPIIKAGIAKRVTVDGPEPIPGFRYIGTPGHSIDHASIFLEHDGEKAFFWGDVLHHPVQLANLNWNSVFCEFLGPAQNARRKALDIAADTGALVFTTHFPGSSAGRIERDGLNYRWLPENGESR